MKTEYTIGVPEDIKKELANQNRDIIKQATELIIKTEPDNTKAVGLLGLIRGARNRVIDVFKPSKSAAKSAYDEIRKLEGLFLNPLETAEETVKEKVGAYVQAENERREEMQRKADERYQKSVDRAVEKGKPITQAQVIIPKGTAPGNASYRTIWSAVVTDLKALCKAVAEGTVPLEAIQPNMPVLHAMARASKEAFNVPGVKAVSSVSTAIRQ